MKLETIVKRYERLGYVPSGYDRDIETGLINKWLFETFNIYVDVIHLTLKVRDSEDMYLKFTYNIIYKVNDPISNFYGEKSFKTPFDAVFDGICRAYSIVKNEFEREKFSNER